MARTAKNKLKAVPVFASEAEEREFWLTHDTTKYFDDTKTESARFPRLKPRKSATSTRSTKH
jgi:hypothetical protein